MPKLIPVFNSSPSHWLDGTPVSFINWQSGAPNGDDFRECARMNGKESDPEKYGTWYNIRCQDEYHYYPVCMKPAIKGPPIPDNEIPTIPPHENCDPHYYYSDAVF